MIDSKPERVATVAWANHEVPLALGVVPVGMSKATWGDDDDDGVLPWVEDRLAELGAETPVLFDETDGIDFEAVANTEPDVILASYSGITQEEYDTLSKIAPVVAYPDVAWGTSIQDMILLNDARRWAWPPRASSSSPTSRTRSQRRFAEYPQLADKTIVFSDIDAADTSQIGFYTTHDTRPGFLIDLGMGTPNLVADRSATTDAFYETISAEEGDQFADADIFVTYGNDSTLAALQADELLATIPAIDVVRSWCCSRPRWLRRPTPPRCRSAGGWTSTSRRSQRQPTTRERRGGHRPLEGGAVERIGAAPPRADGWCGSRLHCWCCCCWCCIGCLRAGSSAGGTCSPHSEGIRTESPGSRFASGFPAPCWPSWSVRRSRWVERFSRA